MRIALVTFSFPWPENPGTGIYNLLQAQALARLGHSVEVFVCALRFPRALERIKPGLRRLNERPREWTYGSPPIAAHAVPGMYPQPMWIRRNFAMRFAPLVDWSIRAVWGRGLRRALSRFAPHGVYVHDGVLLGGLVAGAAASLGVPFAIIEHDAVVWDRDSALGRHYASVARRAGAVFGVGLPSVWALRERLSLTNARFCPNGIARASAEQLAAPRPEKYRGKRIVLTAGSATPLKGHAELIRAFADAAVPDSLLLMIGSAPPAELLALIDQLGLSDRVERLGHMPQQDLQQYMAWADVFALPSRLESFGMVYGEALAAGTPVILTSAAGIAPTLRHGVHGWIVPPLDHDALVNALRESLRPGVKATMGDAGRAIIGTTFTWEVSARAIVAGLRGQTPPAGLEPDLSNVEALRAALPPTIG